MKLFLDANVIFSGSREASELHRMLSLLRSKHSLITSDYAQAEANRNIRVKRPDWEPGYNRLMDGIQVVQSIDCPLEVELPPKDRPILATAIHCNCDYLITGDKRDFGHLFNKTVQGVRVLSPLMLAQTLL